MQWCGGSTWLDAGMIPAAQSVIQNTTIWPMPTRALLLHNLIRPLQVAQSDKDAELSHQYMAGPNAKRRSRAPAANRAQPKPAHAAPPGLLRQIKSADPANDKATGSSDEPDSAPASKFLSRLSSKHSRQPKLVHSDTLSRQDRYMVNTGRMSMQDPFQDLAEQTFHRNVVLAEDAADAIIHLPSGAAAAGDMGMRHGARIKSQAVNKRGQLWTPRQPCRVWDAQERRAFHERCAVSLPE